MIELSTPTTYDISTDSLRFLREFINRDSAYAVQKERGYWKVDGMLTDDVLFSHIIGETTIGTYQLMYGMVTWACYDIDSHDDSDITSADNELLLIINRLWERGIPYIYETSGTPHSYHVFVMLEPTDVTVAHYFFRELVNDLGVNCEIYPKQIDYNPEKPYGNLVKLPLGINRKNDEWSTIPDVVVDVQRVKIIDYDFRAAELKMKESDVYVTDASKIVGTYDGVGLMPLNMRPCLLSAMSETLTGTHGHVMRCALVPELRKCLGMSFNDVVDQFMSQSDFNRDICEEQVRSVWRYNRYTCAYIRSNGNVNCEGCEWNNDK